MQTTSVSLLERLAQDGDNADWQRLITLYKPFIEKIVRGYPALASHAEDVAQEVMLVLMRELPVFQRQRAGSFRTWLRGVTVNQLRKSLRQNKRSPVEAGDLPQLEEQLAQLADPMSVVAKNWDDEHDRAVLARVMEIVKNDFQPQTWQAFELYAIREQPPAQVADELGISINSVLLAKSRILRRMREEAAGLVD